jgi:microcystin degradation protein MlrC
MTNSEKKKIVIGSLRQETNSFSPVITYEKDFLVCRGRDVLQQTPVSRILEEAGFEVVPTLWAYAIPSGKVDKKAYCRFKEIIMNAIPKDGSVAGVWLYLHGAMNVTEIGSGEGPLVEEVRRLVGPKVPIAVALDFHANNTEQLVKNANIICGYRTAPHTDEEETQERAARLLLRCILENVLPECVMVCPPLLFPGEMITTEVDPCKSLIAELKKAEEKQGVWTASLFGGMPWCDAPNAGASVVVCGPKGCKEPTDEAKRIADLFWKEREKFGFEEKAMSPEDAILWAQEREAYPIFISDSGDNVTGGAPGDSAYLLSLLMKHECKNVLVAGIVDRPAVEAFYLSAEGEEKKVKIGKSIDSKSTETEVTGKLKQKGFIERGGSKDIRFALIAVGGIDIILTDERCSFTTQKNIEETGAKIPDYHAIVVKLGYLFPDLRRIAKDSVMALTPGNCGLRIEDFDFKNIRRPMYPVDKNFDWKG